MVKFKKLALVLLVILSLVLVGCTDPNPDPNPTPDVTGYQYDGTLTVGPYKVYNEDGTIFEAYTSVSGTAVKVESFDDMFTAIRIAGENSKSTNKMYVEDANGLMIFKRQGKNDCWCYDGTYFVGVKTKSEAQAWSATKTKSYVVDGQGKGYITLGTDWYENTDSTQDIPLELISGGYNYLFSKSGRIESDVWVEKGYGYCEFIVRLSEATYMPTNEPYTDYDGQTYANQWNAYIFVNGSGGISSDLGLIGVIRGDEVVWAPVRNCGHEDHKATGDSFAVLGWENALTTMKYDPEKGCYCGADDLLFQCYQGVDGWTLIMTNLTTGYKYTLNEHHKGMFADSTQYMRFLIAASYCPVNNSIWNARSGAYLRNVVFENAVIAKWNENETYDESMYEEFYPGSSNMIYGFSQVGDCASMKMEVTESGVRRFSFSCYYDGGEH